MTPARSSASHLSRNVSSTNTEEDDEEERYPKCNKYGSYVSENVPIQNAKSSHEGTLIGTTASESNTLKNQNSKERNSLKKQKSEESIESASLDEILSDVIISSKSLEEQPEVSSPNTREFTPPVLGSSPKPTPNDQTFKGSENDAMTLKKEDEDYQDINNKEKAKEDLYEMQHKEEEELKDHPQQNLNIHQLNVKVDVEEPSFANTLDGIETLRTHEVVDYEPNSHYLVPEKIIDTREQITRELEALMPPPKDVERRTPELEAHIIKLDYETYEKIEDVNDIIKEDLPIVPAMQTTKNEEKGKDQDRIKESKRPIHPSSPDQSYEVIHPPENPAKEAIKIDTNTIKRRASPGRKQNSLSKSPSKEEVVENNIAQETSEYKTYHSDTKEEEEQVQNLEEDSEMNEMVEEEGEQNEEEYEEEEEEVEEEKLPAKELSPEREDFIEVDTSTSENLNEDNHFQQREDRQQTPLSISSSDAQFYSPPNSPVLSVNERLLGKRNANESQVIFFYFGSWSR